MERLIKSYGGYFNDFYKSLTPQEQEKFDYVLTALKTQQVISSKWIKCLGDGLYELRIEYNSNIYRVFFIFDKGNIVILFNGFQKKSQKTPKKEIELARKLMKLYYESKRNSSEKQS